MQGMLRLLRGICINIGATFTGRVRRLQGLRFLEDRQCLVWSLKA